MVFGVAIRNFTWIAEFITLRLFYDRLGRGCIGKEGGKEGRREANLIIDSRCSGVVNQVLSIPGDERCDYDSPTAVVFKLFSPAFPQKGCHPYHMSFVKGRDILAICPFNKKYISGRNSRNGQLRVN